MPCMTCSLSCGRDRPWFVAWFYYLRTYNRSSPRRGLHFTSLRAHYTAFRILQISASMPKRKCDPKEDTTPTTPPVLSVLREKTLGGSAMSTPVAASYWNRAWWLSFGSWIFPQRMEVKEWWRSCHSCQSLTHHIHRRRCLSRPSSASGVRLDGCIYQTLEASIIIVENLELFQSFWRTIPMLI